MRDAILDRVFQPAIVQLQLNPRTLSFEFSHAFCALQLVAMSRNAIVQGDLVGPAIGAAVATAMMHGMRQSARQGSSLLATHFGLLHMLARVVALAIGAMSLLGVAGDLTLGLPHPHAFVDLLIGAAFLSASASLYLGVCDQPPKRPRRQRQRQRIRGPVGA